MQVQLLLALPIFPAASCCGSLRRLAFCPVGQPPKREIEETQVFTSKTAIAGHGIGRRDRQINHEGESHDYSYQNMQSALAAAGAVSPAQVMEGRAMSEHTKHDNVGFLGLLALLFIGLKLTDQINWSWWWVLSPIYAKCGITIDEVLIESFLEAWDETVRRTR